MAEGQPLLPRSRSNPIGGTRFVERAESRVKRQLRRVKRWLIDEIESIPARQIGVNHVAVSSPVPYVIANRLYEYQISVAELDRLVRDITRELDTIPSDYVLSQTLAAYEFATGQAVTNLARISDTYTRELTQVITSEPYRRRTALIGSRVFEQMQGFKGETATDLSRVLMNGVENGLNPRDLVGELRQRFGVSESRAERIARTEIGTAQRRARWDEALDAEERLGIRTGLLWLSALSPTTRASHAARHGEVYDQESVREFYSRDGNSVNCKCSQVSVLLDDEGRPATPEIIDRVRAYK